MELFFNSFAQKNMDEIEFDDFESKHIQKSKRKKIADEIKFTNGNGDLFSGKIISVKPKVICNCDWLKNIPRSKNKVTLAIGFIRQNRLDYLIEKITEIGIGKIILFASQNGNYFTKNIDRWVKITRQAIKQSLQYYLPEIEVIEKYEQMIEMYKDEQIKLISDQHAPLKLSEYMNLLSDKTYNNIIYTIGPEGGLTKEEIEYAILNGFTNISLGGNRLRAETAAIALGSYLSISTY